MQDGHQVAGDGAAAQGLGQLGGGAGAKEDHGLGLRLGDELAHQGLAHAKEQSSMNSGHGVPPEMAAAGSS